jgi:glycosyltransferase involved in cell wall biosynthesis
MKISSLIIAKNEEDNIKRCIQSQLNCIDDILILIDNSSTDNTLQVVKSFPQARFELVKWEGYVKTKRNGLSKTKFDWIFWIDADEAITPELQKEIIEFKSSTPVFVAYTIPRRAYFLGKWIKHCGWYPSRATRLFNKTKIDFNENQVHEQLIVNGKKGQLKNDLNHFTDPDLKHYYEKFNNYTSLAANDLMKRNKKFSKFKLLFNPFFLFIKMYIFRRGFLDGIQGFILSFSSANYVFTKYAKLWELSIKENKK